MTKKVILWIVAIIIIIGIIVFINAQSAAKTKMTSSADVSTSQPAMSDPSDTSNQALAQDMTSIDAQMGGLNQDNAAADQSLNNPNQ